MNIIWRKAKHLITVNKPIHYHANIRIAPLLLRYRKISSEYDPSGKIMQPWSLFISREDAFLYYYLAPLKLENLNEYFRRKSVYTGTHNGLLFWRLNSKKKYEKG